jgi:FMN-dependent NADH-azoreductase
MANILHIDSSPRGDRSKSRKLAKEFIAVWQDQHPDDVITYRDLTHILHHSQQDLKNRVYQRTIKVFRLQQSQETRFLALVQDLS